MDSETQAELQRQEDALRLIGLCADVIVDLTKEAQDPGNPESRADFLLEVEALAEEVAKLLRAARRIAWGSNDLAASRPVVDDSLGDPQVD